MILFLSPYPPRESGLAQYSHQLVGALQEHFEPQSLSVAIGALQEGGAEPRLYPDEVRYILSTADRQTCQQLAHRINTDQEINGVCVQHRFGLWGGGNWGENILVFAEALEKPLMVVLHNVLPEPEPALLRLVTTLAQRADLLITKTKYHAQLLQHDYGVAADLVRIIPPAAPVVATANKEVLKKAYMLEGRLVLTYFGYLRRSKGLEHVLEALDEIRKKYPTAILLLLGPTHELAARYEGERYRFQLKDLVLRRGLQKHVHFVNRVLKPKELQDYLRLTDVYLHISKNNAGSLLQAMGCGCSIIATPSPVTQELLPAHAGVLVQPENTAHLAAVVMKLFASADLRSSKGAQALQAARPYAWPNVALAYQEALSELVPALVRYRLPVLSIHSLKEATTEKGVGETVAAPQERAMVAYTLADNAKALLVSLQLYQHSPTEEVLQLVRCYLQVLARYQQEDGTFVSSSLNAEQQEEADMQALWAVGYLRSQHNSLPQDLVAQAEGIFQKTLPQLAHVKTLRAFSYAIKGLYYYNLARQDERISELLDAQAAKLQERFTEMASKEWAWFEKGLQHANSILPEALLLAWEDTGKEVYRKTAQRSFKFLLNFLFMDDPLPATGRHSVQLGGEDRFGFSNNPLDVAETIMTLNRFYELTGEEGYLDKMRTAFSWFLGNNHIRQVMYCSATGYCYDGIEGKGVKHRQSTSSLLYYLLSRLVMEAHVLQLHTSRRAMLPERRSAGMSGLSAVPADRPSMPSEQAQAVVK